MAASHTQPAITETAYAAGFAEPKAPDMQGQSSPINAAGEGERIQGITKEYSGWDVYNNEARKVDIELVKDWTSSLNFLLIFAAIFAAVLTAFIIESKKMLEPDSTAVMVEVMIFYTNNVANGSHIPYLPTVFEATPSSIVVNCLFFASLSASLFAALASVVSLQWVADYDAAITRGGSSPEDRAKHRQFRFAGVIQWKMSKIIAALPLLLYFSVVLFFAGLILWMWVTNYIVGTVVAGGAAITLFFYGASTFVAAIFVSAPFRTPLSRWLYSLARIIFWGVYRLSRLTRNDSITAWFERQNILHISARRREKDAVENGPDLGKDALIWLANQLSISQDSYRRLLLLVSELPNLMEEHTPSFGSMEAPWYWIFDLLGWRNLTVDTLKNLDAEERRRGMEILWRCYTIPAIRQLVEPKGTNYNNDKGQPDYWSQFCELEPVWTLDPTVPNRLFLLLRDTPNPARNSVYETEASMQVAQWRNSFGAKRPGAWDEVLKHGRVFSSAFFNTCVATFGDYYRLHYPWRTNVATCLTIIRNIVEMAARRRDLLPQTTVSLTQAYESLMTGKFGTQGATSLYFLRPLEYAMRLQERSSDDHTVHDSIIFMLSQQLGLHPKSEIDTRFEEIITLLWSRPSNPAIRHWEELVNKHGEDGHPGPTTVRDWIGNADRVPHIIEIMRHLSEARSKSPHVGPLWRTAVAGEFNNPHFVEVLQVFDRLMGPDCTANDHQSMVKILLQDLEMDPRPDFEGYFTKTRVDSLSQLKDLCLQIIVSCSKGAEHIEPIIVSTAYREQRRDSLDFVGQYIFKRYPHADVSSILELEASLWPAGRAFRDSDPLENRDAFLHQQRIFHFPVHCPDCHDGPGHFVFHLLGTIPGTKFPTDVTLLETISLQGLEMGPTLILLALWSVGDTIPLPYIVGSTDEWLLQPIKDALESIKSSQIQLLTLIWNEARFLERNWVFSADCAAILVGIQKALALPHDPDANHIFISLSKSILQLRRRMLGSKLFHLSERKIVAAEALKTSCQLLSALATRSIFGSLQGRVISCARAHGEIVPAVGWLPPFH